MNFLSLDKLNCNLLIVHKLINRNIIPKIPNGIVISANKNTYPVNILARSNIVNIDVFVNIA